MIVQFDRQQAAPKIFQALKDARSELNNERSEKWSVDILTPYEGNIYRISDGRRKYGHINQCAVIRATNSKKNTLFLASLQLMSDASVKEIQFLISTNDVEIERAFERFLSAFANKLSEETVGDTLP